MEVRRAVDGDARHTLMGGQDRPRCRVVSCDQYIDPGAVPTYCVTDVVGRRVWLRSVRLWFGGGNEEITEYTYFRVFTGTTEISTAADILGWEEVLPKLYNNIQRTTWRHHDRQPGMVWTLENLYRGESRRFGLWISRVGSWADWVQASFEVSEE